MIKAYRVFRIDKKQMVLTSVTKKSSRIMSAIFGKYTEYDGVQHVDESGNGFYAMKEYRELWNDEASIVAEVLLYGRIVECEKGYRAEKMKISAIIGSFWADFSYVKEIADKYNLPITERKVTTKLINRIRPYITIACLCFLGIIVTTCIPTLTQYVLIRPNLAEPVYLTNKLSGLALVFSYAVPVMIIYTLWQFRKGIHKNKWVEVSK